MATYGGSPRGDVGLQALIDDSTRRRRGRVCPWPRTVYRTLAVAPALDIATNLFLGRELRRDGLLGRLRVLDRKAMRTEARNQLDALGIATIQNITQLVETLSGGQRQAVAVARRRCSAARS